MVLHLFVQVLKKVLKSLKFEFKNPAETLWCHVDYFTNVLAKFLGLKTFLLRCWRFRKLSDFIKKILICVLKMNEGLTGLERHEGE